MPTTQRRVTLAAIISVAVAALALGLDIGYLAVSAAVLLQLVFKVPNALRGVSWDVILLVSGVLTFIDMLDRAGTIDRIGGSIANFDSPVFAALLLCGIAALVSAFASSTGTIGVMIPLAAPLAAAGDVSAIGLVAAVCVSATVVDASPFSGAGALVVAGAVEDDRRQLYRGLLAWGMSMIVVAPVLAVTVLVLPGLL